LPKHTPWKKPAIQEALFEVHFPAVEDYAIFAGGMALELGKLFPIHEKISDFPDFIQIEGVLRHRFKTQDTGLICQIGADTLTVNVIKYIGFNNFIENIEKVLVSASKFTKIKNLNKLGLRYINNFPNIQEPFQTLNISSPFTEFDSNRVQELSIKQVQIESEHFTSSIDIHSVIRDSYLILDIDVFHISSTDEWEMQRILKWVDDAHEIIYNKFENTICDIEKNKRK